MVWLSLLNRAATGVGQKTRFRLTQARETRRFSRQSNLDAVAFLTHLFDESIDSRYRKLKSDLGGWAEIFIVAPVGTSIPPQYLNETYFFDYDRLRSDSARVIGDKLIPGNVHLVALDFYRRHSRFSYYWFIEHDVVFTGNWATLLESMQSDRADLLVGHVRSFAEEPEWEWWDTLDFPGCPLPRSSWIRAFFPVYRISSEGLRAVEACVRNGWSGHFEGLIPCAIQAASLSISDLGGAGSWTPIQRRHQFYSSFSSDAGKSLNAGTLRHRPNHFFPPLRRNAVFHPVKTGSSRWDRGVVQFLKDQHLRELWVRCAVSVYFNWLCLWSIFRKQLAKNSSHAR